MKTLNGQIGRSQPDSRIRNRLAYLLLFLFAGTGIISGRADIALARDLFEDKLWEDCRIEARRVLAANPDNYEARLIAARTGNRLGIDVRADLAKMAADMATPPELQLAAQYEEGILAWRNGEFPAAATAFRNIFLKTSDRALFLHAGCALAIVLHDYSPHWSDMESLSEQLRTTVPRWTPELIKNVKNELGDQNRRIGFQPGGLFIAFYRTQIRPAIGNRCILAPSCSEYSRQAFKKHGVLLGSALTADRFIREPGVVSAAARPVERGSRICYADPLSDHDWWME